MTTDLQFTTIGRRYQIGQIMLNRPQTINAITPAMAQAISQQLSTWQSDDAIQAVVMRGNGERGFCAGGDLLALKDLVESNFPEASSLAWLEYRLIHQIANYPKPYIALCHRITMGGGVGVAIHGSHRIASPDLRFAMPETRIGFFPDVGASYFLSQCPGHSGKLLALAACEISAADSLALGLMDMVIDHQQFDAVVDALANRPLSSPREVSDRLFEFHQSPPASDLIAKQALIEQLFSPPTLEGILAQLEVTDTAWVASIHQQILANAPLSLKIALQAQQHGRHQTLAETLEMEYHLALRCCRQPDFVEGVRARIVDKDNRPQWLPATVDAVTEAQLAELFTPVPGHSLGLADHKPQ